MKRIAFPIQMMLLSSTAYGALPTLGGPMSHILITLFQNEIYLSFESPSMSVVTMQNAEDDFIGSASVLNNTGYNAQFGWLANGFISLPQDSGIFIRTISSSPHLGVYDETTFQGIMGTDTSPDLWQWDGTMTHNWYSTDTHGLHHARYEVFVADLAGNPLGGFTPGTIDLVFDYQPDLRGRIGPSSGTTSPLPTPPAASLLMLGALTVARRKRID